MIYMYMYTKFFQIHICRGCIKGVVLYLLYICVSYCMHVLCVHQFSNVCAHAYVYSVQCAK